MASKTKFKVGDKVKVKSLYRVVWSITDRIGTVIKVPKNIAYPCIVDFGIKGWRRAEIGGMGLKLASSQRKRK